ncbi:MAG: hypothetical protein FWD58_07320 [Firmicutes bacterium]|nr:hypothetical protein [Bacillota bacterium]
MPNPANYDATIQSLKKRGMLRANDVFAFGRYYQKFNLLDIFTNTVRWSKVDYLLATDGETLKVFAIHKRTGDCLDQFNEQLTLDKKQIDKLKCKKEITILGRAQKIFKVNIRAKVKGVKLDMRIGNVHRKYPQEANKDALVNILLSRFVDQVGLPKY